MPRIRYEPADDVCEAVKALTKLDEFSHIDASRVYCVRSYGARTSAIARIYGTPRAWLAVGRQPEYLIEVIAEKFYRLSPTRRLEVIIHELLHIPKTFSGGLRPHGRHVNDVKVKSIYAKAASMGIASNTIRIWRSFGSPSRSKKRAGPSM